MKESGNWRRLYRYLLRIIKEIIEKIDDKGIEL